MASLIVVCLAKRPYRSSPIVSQIYHMALRNLQTGARYGEENVDVCPSYPKLQCHLNYLVEPNSKKVP